MAVAVEVPVNVRKRMSPIAKRQFRLAMLFISPWVIGFLAFNLYPMISSFVYSFTQFNLFQPPQWVGLQNYAQMFSSHDFWQSLYNTLYFTVFGVGLQLVLGLATAMLLNLKVKGQAIYRTLYFLPSVMPPVASSLLWLWLLNPQYGLVNGALGLLHLPQPLWLTSAVWSKPAMILMSLWGVGTTTIIYLAGLSDVPTSLYEAVEIDGGGAWARFRHVTLPMISPITFFQLVSGLIGAISMFTQAYVVSGGNTTLGGPDNSLLFYTVDLYQNAFTYLKMGLADAQAWVLLVIILIITLVVYKTSNRWMYYGGQ